VTLPPRATRTFEVRFFSGPSPDLAASREGLITVTDAAGAVPGTPTAYVNLVVGGSAGGVPELLLGGKPAEYLAFAPLSSTADERPRIPAEITLRNPTASPMLVGGEIGPELWLVPEAGWNAPLAPGATRVVRFTTNRSLAPNASALPRYTFFTMRSRDGVTRRLLVQDNEGAPLAAGRPSRLLPGERSYMVPSAVSTSTFVTRLRLSNTGNAAVQADLFYTPHDEDGFSSAVRRATIVVPPNDVVSLTDPLAQVFGATSAFGSLEVRAAQDRIGFLTVTSLVDAPAASGGSFGFQMPTALRGEGARVGVPHVVTGVTSTDAFRTNLLLTETTGTDAAVVEVALHDRDGTAIGTRQVTVPRYGLTQLTRVAELLGGGTHLPSARLDVRVVSGGGSVLPIITVIDNTNADAVTYAGTPVAGSSSATRRPQAVSLGRYVVPAVVNGFPTFRSGDRPFTFRSLMGFSAGGLEPVTFSLEYHDLQTGRTITRSVTVELRKTTEFANVLEELFGIPAGARSQGPIFVDVSGNGILYCKVYSNLDAGSLGDAFPIIPVPYTALVSRTDQKPMAIDGLEQSVDLSRGTRSNLILNEVSGKGVTVTVRLYEPGNRSVPIAQKDYVLQPLEKVQLSTVFEALGLGQPEGSAEPRLKDRTNVQCVVSWKDGEGSASAVVTTIDNRTGDTKNSLLTPTGGVGATGPAIGF
jgi:hypothetical protein